MPATRFLSAHTTQQWLHDGQELALLDVREPGQFGQGHPFFAVPLPYSRLEADVGALVPRPDTRTVLIDAGDGVAQRAAHRLQHLGYTQIHILQGGAPAWAQAGFTLFQGVNLPSKTFGECVEHAYGTPHISAQALHALQTQGTPFVLLDGRTLPEHRKMTIPGALPMPNGELARHWRQRVPDAHTPIVIHCAGRTRSIVGAQILRSLGVPNPVMALENGTQGWALAGLALEHGSPRKLEAQPTHPPHPDDQAAAARAARDAGVQRLNTTQAQAWLDDLARTTYVLDVRSAPEYAAGTLPGARHAPGGQLLQATDQTLGVRGGRVVLLDDDDLRAPVVATWLARMGWETAVVTGGIHAPLRCPEAPLRAVPQDAPPQPPASLAHWWSTQHPLCIDLQNSLAHRQRHPAGAVWSVRPRIVETLQACGAGPERPVLLLAPELPLAQWAAIDVREAGWSSIHIATLADEAAAGLPHTASPNEPSDADAIDYLFFVHDRHDGNLDAARRYLAWETGLIAQCTAQELSGFRLPKQP